MRRKRERECEYVRERERASSWFEDIGWPNICFLTGVSVAKGGLGKSKSSLWHQKGKLEIHQVSAASSLSKYHVTYLEGKIFKLFLLFSVLWCAEVGTVLPVFAFRFTWCSIILIKYVVKCCSWIASVACSINLFGRHTIDWMARWQKEKWRLTEKIFN